MEAYRLRVPDLPVPFNMNEYHNFYSNSFMHMMETEDIEDYNNVIKIYEKKYDCRVIVYEGIEGQKQDTWEFIEFPTAEKALIFLLQWS